MDPDGTLFLLDARTGKLLYSYKTLQTSGCGPAVVDGRAYVGSGYANFGLGLPGDKLHMLSL
jgi:polyvinyl alcohol dehydrogenase (cytochrome)